MPVMVDAVSRLINPTRLLLSRTRALLLKERGAAFESVLCVGASVKAVRIGTGGGGTKLFTEAAGTEKRWIVKQDDNIPNKPGNYLWASNQVSIVCNH